MSDPLALLPYAMAAAGGRVAGLPAEQLAAAGLTLLQRSAPLVRALAGRRAAILLPTSPHYLVALAACEGRAAVLVNPLAAPLEIAFQLRDADVGAVLTVSALADRLPPDVPRVLLDAAPRSATVVADGTAREVDLGSHVGLELAGETDVAGRDEEAAVVYTSAMAGTPLGAVLTHRNLLANARATVEAGEYGRDDHVLALLPFSHLFGLVVTGVAPLLAGARVSTVDRFHPIRAAEQLVTQDVSVVVGVPAVFGALLAALERRPERPASLRLCICGGAPLPVELQTRWRERTGVELRQGYGLTEAGPVCLFNRVSLPNHVGALGVEFPGVEVMLRDPQSGAAVPDGTEGEICVRGENVSAGYVRDGHLGLQRDGDWLRTGDLGLRQDDGAVRFRGLLKPMFTRNGFNIYPREIERAVGELAGVEHVRAYGIPAPEREHDIALEVTGSVTADDIRRWCASRLSAYKQPSEIVVND